MSSVDDHGADRRARGRLDGPFPTAVDLDQIQEGAEHSLEVTDDGSTTGAGEFVEGPRQRLGVGLGPGGPVGRLAQFLVARRALHFGFVGRVLCVHSLLTGTRQRVTSLVEGVAHHLVFRGALGDARPRVTEARRGAPLALAQ